jgi:NCAIR mutase (PurE)-related protein
LNDHGTRGLLPHGIRGLLEDVREGRLDVDEGLSRLRGWPFLDLGHTRIDTQRELRCGQAEVVYGEGKTPEQLLEIARAILEHHGRLLVTRVKPEAGARLAAEIPGAVHRPSSRTVVVAPGSNGIGEGMVLVVSAGTSDLQVAEEAAVVARHMGAEVRELHDVGVAGIHRLLAHTESLREARVLVVVAGMEGALPSVVGGLVDRPVIAVPTSIGYGASFGGLAALLAMLNSCAAGVAVVNIDNGFGAGYLAAMINRRDRRTERTKEEEGKG